MQYTSHNVAETQLFAQGQARELIAAGNGRPIVVALEGELGAGKTTFTQAFCEELGVHEKVKSPTFVLMKRYALHAVPGYAHLYHLDCYRLQGADDLAPLGLEEILKTTGTIVLIEWAERVKEALPADRITIRFEHAAHDERTIHVINP